MKTNEIEAINKYKKIYEWYSAIGREILRSDFAKLIFRNQSELNIDSIKGVWFNLEFIENLPKPEEITVELIKYILTQVIYGKLEWAFNFKDKDNIKMSEYAKNIGDIYYPGNPGNGWRSINEEVYSETNLFKIFGKHHENIDKYIDSVIEKGKKYNIYDS